MHPNTPLELMLKVTEVFVLAYRKNRPLCEPCHILNILEQVGETLRYRHILCSTTVVYPLRSSTSKEVII
jgi:hypothetical protein